MWLLLLALSTAGSGPVFLTPAHGAEPAPEERERVSGLTSVRPNAWSRRVPDTQDVALAPPGLDGHRRSVEGTARRSRAGGRNRSEAKLGTAHGQPSGTVVHGLRFPLPAAWARIDDPSGKVTLVPNQLQGVLPYYLSVLPPTRQNGTPWESHRALLEAVLGQVQWTEPPVTRHYVDAPGPFIRTSIAGRIATGAIQSLELYTATHEGTVETVVGVNGIDRNVVDPVLRGVTFRNPGSPRARPRIVEAYRRIDQKTYLNAQGGAPVAGSLMYQRIWLWEGGVADFSGIYPEGFAASATVLKVDPGMLDGDYGRWTADGNEIQIVRRAGGPPEIYRRENGGLTGGGQWWEPMPRVDGLTLAGRWSMRSAPGSSSPYYDWIEFRPDGTFATEGVLRHVAAGDTDRPKPPERATGTYRIRDWTIFFTFADGSAWSTDFSTLGRDGAGSGSILFKTTGYPRER